MEQNIIFAGLLIILAGFSTKLLDGFVIKNKIKDQIYLLINILIILSGALFAIFISPEVVLSLLIALIVMGKIDKPGLRFAYAFVLILSLAIIRDVSVINPLSVAILTICAIVDETEMKIIRDYRPSMWLGAILIGLLGFGWMALFVIVAFDIGYKISAKIKPGVLKLLK